MRLVVTIGLEIGIEIGTLIEMYRLGFRNVILFMLCVKLNGSYLRKWILLSNRVKSVILDFLFLFGWSNVNFVIYVETIILRLHVLLIAFLLESQILDDYLKPFFVLITELIYVFAIFHFTLEGRIKTIFDVVVRSSRKIFRDFRPFITIFLVS